MHRPNLAMDAPPTKISVGGAAYPVNVDYRLWIGVLERLKDLLPEARDARDAVQNARVLMDIERAVFGRVLPCGAAEVLDAVIGFARGYPQMPVSGEGEAGDALYSFDWDISAIIIAIRDQSGTDLSYRRKEPFHWWLFLEEFRSLAGEHCILRRMEIRSYRGKDPDLKRLARQYALPREESAADRQLLDAFDRMFENA